MRSAIIFDLDGTLTKPHINFDAIRAEIGIASGTILEAMEVMSAAQRTRAEAIVLRHEWEAARNGSLYEDAGQVLMECRRLGYALGLLTRNSRPVVDFILEKHALRFDSIRTREDGAVKPSPIPVVSICEELQADLHRSWVVGDFLYDLISGRQAGCHTVLMIGDGPVPEFAGQAEFLIRRLRELPRILVPYPRGQGCSRMFLSKASP